MSILDLFRLDGKTALVTGCKRGIGKAIALGLAEAGADIIGVSATLEAGGSDVERQVPRPDRRFNGYACDLSDRPALYAFIARAKRIPRIDILINNAGTILANPPPNILTSIGTRSWKPISTPSSSSRGNSARGCIARGSGKIIFIASLLPSRAASRVPGYAASKGAIGQLTKALANEWARHGCERQRHRTRLHRDRRPRPCATIPNATRPSWPASRPAGGDAPRIQRRGRLSGLRRRRLCRGQS